MCMKHVSMLSLYPNTAASDTSTPIPQIREELVHLLDDDQDMAELYLTRKQLWLKTPDSPTASASRAIPLEDDDIHSRSHPHSFTHSYPHGPSGMTPAASWRPPGGSGVQIGNDGYEDENVPMDVPAREVSVSTGSSASVEGSGKGGEDVSELEMLLEVYFVAADRLLKDLTTVSRGCEGGGWEEEKRGAEGRKETCADSYSAEFSTSDHYFIIRSA